LGGDHGNGRGADAICRAASTGSPAFLRIETVGGATPISNRGR